MATRTIPEESGARSEPAPPISSAWMPRKLTAAASDSLDLIRALAACAVIVGHLRALFFVDFRQLSHECWPLQALYFLTGFGHQVVVVFFVLSGFLISSTVIRSHVLGKWSWRDYAVNRATRLYVVLIPGLLLGFFWDRLGSRLFAAKGIYAHPLADLGPAVPLQNFTSGNFLGNLFFLQTIFCDTFGSNGPLRFHALSCCRAPDCRPPEFFSLFGPCASIRRFSLRRTFSMPHPSVREAFFLPGWFHSLQRQRQTLLEHT